MFRLTFLGTSSGVPTKERNVSALAVECIHQDSNAKNHPWILVDCGEGTQQQILKSELSFGGLRAILITHTHGDHCYGLAGLLSTLGMQARKDKLTIIAPKAIAKMLDTMTVVSELYFNYPIEFMAIEDMIKNRQSDNKDNTADISINIKKNHQIDITLHSLLHRCPSYAFAITQIIKKENLDTQKLTNQNINKENWRSILASTQKDKPMRINDLSIIPNDFILSTVNELKIVIAGDNDTPQLLSYAVKNAIALVHEATYTHDIMLKIINRDEGAFDPKHSSGKTIAEFAQNSKMPNLLLTHFSPRYASFEDKNSNKLNMGHIRDEVERYYKGNVILAKDFLRVLIDECKVEVLP